MDRMIMFNMFLNGLSNCLILDSEGERVTVDPAKLMQLVDHILADETKTLCADCISCGCKR